MAYTVTKLAKISGVSVRTLHFYDEMGLLKPAYYGANGYRYYEEEQLLILQQILFFRELGFELKKIQKLLGRSDFDKMVALSSHRQVLQNNVVRTQQLIKTIDKTIKHLRGTKKMKEQEMYHGFSEERQPEYEKYLIDRFGEKVKKTFAECKKNTQNWTQADWDKVKEDSKTICQELVRLMKKDYEVDSKEVQKVISQHYQMLKKFWTPDKDSYSGHGQLIADSELRQAYEVYHPKLPEFICKAIHVFAERELT